MIPSPFNYPPFKLKDLHKKIGQLIYQEPTDSDMAEGYALSQLWFRDDKNNLYLIWEGKNAEDSHRSE